MGFSRSHLSGVRGRGKERGAYPECRHDEKGTLYGRQGSLHKEGEGLGERENTPFSKPERRKEILESGKAATEKISDLGLFNHGRARRKRYSDTLISLKSKSQMG